MLLLLGKHGKAERACFRAVILVHTDIGGNHLAMEKGHQVTLWPKVLTALWILFLSAVESWQTHLEKAASRPKCAM